MNGSESIKKWILGMGSRVKVLGPPSLKEEIEEEIHEMMKMYLDF